MITFSAFQNNVKGIAFPERLAENLEDHFRTVVVNGLIEAQTFVPDLRDYHIDFHCEMEFVNFCGAQIFNGPRGVIQKVYAFKPGKDCTKYEYDRRSTGFIDGWIEQSRCAQCNPATPVRDNLYEQPYCDYPSPQDAACDSVYTNFGGESDVCWKHTGRYFAVGPDYRMFLAPRIPCGYILAVQWEGIKRCWRNSDGVMEDEDLKLAVSYFAEAGMAVKDRDVVNYQLLQSKYLGLLKHMAHRCRRERRLTSPHDSSSHIIDALLPFVNPLNLDNPYSVGTCAYNPDTTAPVLVCD